MKTYPRLIATIATCLFLASVGRASAQDERVRAHVPFAFTVGQTTLPSGTYEVTRMHAQTNVIMVRDALHTVILMADTGDRGELDSATRLEFHRYADSTSCGEWCSRERSIWLCRKPRPNAWPPSSVVPSPRPDRRQ